MFVDIHNLVLPLDTAVVNVGSLYPCPIFFNIFDIIVTGGRGRVQGEQA